MPSVGPISHCNFYHTAEEMQGIEGRFLSSTTGSWGIYFRNLISELYKKLTKRENFSYTTDVAIINVDLSEPADRVFIVRNLLIRPHATCFRLYEMILAQLILVCQKIEYGLVIDIQNITGLNTILNKIFGCDHYFSQVGFFYIPREIIIAWKIYSVNVPLLLQISDTVNYNDEIGFIPKFDHCYGISLSQEITKITKTHAKVEGNYRNSFNYYYYIELRAFLMDVNNQHNASFSVLPPIILDRYRAVGCTIQEHNGIITFQNGNIKFFTKTSSVSVAAGGSAMSLTAGGAYPNPMEGGDWTNLRYFAGMPHGIQDLDALAGSLWGVVPDFLMNMSCDDVDDYNGIMPVHDPTNVTRTKKV